MKISKKTRVILVAAGLVGLVLLLGGAVTLSLLAGRLRTLLNKAPDYSGSQLYDKAVQQINTGSYQTAEGYLEQALQKGEDADYRTQLAVVEYQLKKYPEAVAQYQKLVDQGRDPAFAWNGMGNAYRDWYLQSHVADYQAKALAAYQRAVVADPTYVAAYSNWALFEDSLGQRAAALAIIEQGIQNSKNPVLQKLRAQLQAEK